MSRAVTRPRLRWSSDATDCPIAKPPTSSDHHVHWAVSASNQSSRVFGLRESWMRPRICIRSIALVSYSTISHHPRSQSDRPTVAAGQPDTAGEGRERCFHQSIDTSLHPLAPSWPRFYPLCSLLYHSSTTLLPLARSPAEHRSL